MPLSQSVFTAIFVMAVVFAVLVALWTIIRMFSALIRYLERQGKQANAVNNLRA